MQGLVVVGLIFEELSNVDVKCVSHCSTKYRPWSPDQDICRVITSRRSTMQGLMVVGLIVEEISNVDANCVKVTGTQNIGQVHRVKVPAESVNLGEAYARFGGCRPYS